MGLKWLLFPTSRLFLGYETCDMYKMRTQNEAGARMDDVMHYDSEDSQMVM